MAAAGTQQFSDAKVELGQLNTYQKYMIYRETDEKLMDPDTKENLGNLELAIGTGK